MLSPSRVHQAADFWQHPAPVTEEPQTKGLWRPGPADHHTLTEGTACQPQACVLPRALIIIISLFNDPEAKTPLELGIDPH